MSVPNVMLQVHKKSTAISLREKKTKTKLTGINGSDKGVWRLDFNNI